MIYPIYVYGSHVLRDKTAELDKDYPNLNQLISDMFDTLKVADGVGLAAPQIGLSLRLFIVDGSLLGDDHPELKDFKRVMINPRITWESAEKATFNEGCLSIPDINADIERPASITIEYFDQNFEKKVETLDGFACRMVQHEYGHLQGQVFTDLASPIRRKMMHSKLQAIARGKSSAAYRTRLE